MSTVSQFHPGYSLVHPDWEVVRDVSAGERRVKEKGTQYLPIPSRNMKDNLEEYLAYKQRASFQNFTGRTIDSMVGAVFRKDPIMNHSDWGVMQYLLENVDGQQTSLILQAKAATRNVVAAGRDCLFVDFPKDQEGASLEDVERGVAVATIQRRTAEQVINWRWDPFGSENRLVQVVIREDFNKSLDRFGYENDFRYRVLRIDPEDGTYWQDIYVESVGLESPVEQVQVKANGKPLKFIPFIFIGTEQNDAEIDKPPVLDIANTNLAHYRVDAEQKQSMHYHSTPQPVVEGVDQQFIKKYEEEPLTLGSDTVLILPVNARFHISQVDFDHTGYQTELERLEAAMKKMGARLLDDNNRARESGDALGIRQQAENSVMSSISKNVSRAYEQAVFWAGLFMGEGVKPEIMLNTDFKQRTMDANLVAVLSQEVDKKHISIFDYHQALRNGEVIEPDRTTEEILDDTDENPGITVTSPTALGGENV